MRGRSAVAGTRVPIRVVSIFGFLRYAVALFPFTVTTSPGDAVSSSLRFSFTPLGRGTLLSMVTLAPSPAPARKIDPIHCSSGPAVLARTVTARKRMLLLFLFRGWARPLGLWGEVGEKRLRRPVE